MQKQVDCSHYNFGQYIDKKRWLSFYHQIDEIMKTNLNSILESVVGYKPKVSLEDGAKKFIEWFKTLGGRYV